LEERVKHVLWWKRGYTGELVTGICGVGEEGKPIEPKGKGNGK
jgi:hypothetical protein